MDTFHIHNNNQLIIRPTAFSLSTDDRPDSPRQGEVDFHMPLPVEDADQLMRLLADRFPERYAAHVKPRPGTVAAMLDEEMQDLWDSPLAQQLAAPADRANMSDFARIPLKVLADRLGAAGISVDLYHAATRMADAANRAPDPTKLA